MHVLHLFMDFQRPVYSYVLWETQAKNLHLRDLQCVPALGMQPYLQCWDFMGWEPTLTPSGNMQAVPLYPQLISNHNQLLPPWESSLVVCDGTWYTFICPVTWILFNSQIILVYHAWCGSKYSIMPWHSLWGIIILPEVRIIFYEKSQRRTLKPIFPLFMTPVFTLIPTSWGR